MLLSDWLSGHSSGPPRRRRSATRSACCGRLWAWPASCALTPTWSPCTRTLAWSAAGTRSGSCAAPHRPRLPRAAPLTLTRVFVPHLRHICSEACPHWPTPRHVTPHYPDNHTASSRPSGGGQRRVAMATAKHQDPPSNRQQHVHSSTRRLLDWGVGAGLRVRGGARGAPLSQLAFSSTANDAKG